MATLQELLARVEAASGPDRALDRDLYWGLERARAERSFHQAALGLPKPIPAHFGWHDLPGGLGRSNVAIQAPEFTASLDAALALVERVLPGWAPAIRRDARPEFEGLWNAYVAKTGAPREQHSTWGSTPALALLAALLRALIAKEQP